MIYTRNGPVELSIGMDFCKRGRDWRVDVELIGEEMDDTMLFTRDFRVKTVKEAVGHLIPELPGMALLFFRRRDGS